MKREQAYPARRVDRVCVGMMALFGYMCRNVVDGDNSIEDHHNHKAEYAKREVVEKRVAYHPYSPSVVRIISIGASFFDADQPQQTETTMKEMDASAYLARLPKEKAAPRVATRMARTFWHQ
jgi:hypothetical protein